jgi:hypothetical protein
MRHLRKKARREEKDTQNTEDIDLIEKYHKIYF